MPATFNMSDVMVSYSRRDKPFVQRLAQALKDSGREIWIDWDDIPATADWWSEIQAGIDAAHTFVFVITPESVRSAICLQEIDHAAKNNKRIVPVVYQDVTEEADKQRMHPALKIHNWINFHETDDFNESFRNLVNALETDLNHVQIHTRLLVRAQEWDAHERRGSYLLRGDDLRNAENWLTTGINKNPPPTALQAEYISASRRATNRSRQLLVGAMTAVMAVLLLLTLFAVAQTVTATNALEDANRQGTEAALAAGIAQDNMTKAAAAEAQRQIAATAAATAVAMANTQSAIANENQSTADVAGTQAWENQLTANAAGTNGANIQQTADAAGTNAALERATAQTEAANLQLTSDAAGTDAAISKLEATHAQGTANANGTTAAQAGGTANAAQQTAVAIQQTAVSIQQTADAAANAAAIAGQTATPAAQTATAVSEVSQSLALANAARNALAAGDRPLAIHLALLANTIIPNPPLEADSALADVAYSIGLRTSFNGYTSPFKKIAVSNDGRRMVSLGENGIVDIWDVNQTSSTYGQIIVSLDVGTTVKDVDLSPDGKMVIYGGCTFIKNASDCGFDDDKNYGFVHIDDVDPQSSTFTKTIVDEVAYKHWVNAVAFSPDGQWALAGDESGDIKLWNVKRGSPDFGTIKKEGLPTLGYTLQKLKFSADNQWEIVGSNRGVLIASIFGNERYRFDISGFQDAVLSADNKHLVVLDYNGIEMLDGSSPSTSPLFSKGIAQSNSARSVALNADGNLAAIGMTNGSVQLWDTNPASVFFGQSIQEVSGHGGAVNAVVFRPHTNRLFSASSDTTIREWDTESGQIKTIFTGHKGSVTGVAFNPDGSWVLSGDSGSGSDYDSTVQLWDTSGLQAPRTLDTGGLDPIIAVNFSVDGRYALWAGRVPDALAASGLVSFIDLTAISATPEGFRTQGVNAVSFVPNTQQFIASGCKSKSALSPYPCQQGFISRFDMNDSSYDPQYISYNAGSAEVLSIAVSSDGLKMLSGSTDKIMRLWDISKTDQPVATFEGHTQAITAVAFSSDGKRALSGSADGTIRYWNLTLNDKPGTPQDERLISTFSEGGVISSVSFSSDRKYMLVGTGNGRLHLWDINRKSPNYGKVIRVFSGHSGSVNSAILSASGDLALSGSTDKTVRLWHVHTAPELITWACSNLYARPLSSAEQKAYGVTLAQLTALAGRCPAVGKSVSGTTHIAYSNSLSSSANYTNVLPNVDTLTPSPTTIAGDWIPSGGWSPDVSGQEWVVSSGMDISMLTSAHAFDLSDMLSPHFNFISSLSSSASLATVQVSLDGFNWNLLQTLYSPSGEMTLESIDLSAYAGQSIWLQFVWFYTAGASSDSWSVQGMVVSDLPPTATLIPTDTLTPTPTLSETPIITDFPTPSLTPSATWIPDTETPFVTPTEGGETLTPTATHTPSPLPLPIYVSMDDGAPGWIPSTGWFLSDGAHYGDSGQGWFVSAADTTSFLVWQQPIDLRLAAAPHLFFQSLLQSQKSVAFVQISTDNLNWQYLATVSPSTTWQENDMDLSAYRGQIIWLEFVWLYAPPLPDQMADLWMMDALSVIDVPPTSTPTMGYVPTIEIFPTATITPTFTEIPTDMPTPTETATDVPTITTVPTSTWTDEPTIIPSATETPIDVPSDTPDPLMITLETP